MNVIKIGTCIPGVNAVQWIPQLLDKGFESFQLTFHMSTDNIDIKELAKRIEEIIGDRDVKVSTLGFYANPIQHKEDERIFASYIDAAGLFGAERVCGFAGALEGRPVEESMPRFKAVFTELAKRAADKNIKLGIENCPMGGTWEKAACNIGFNPRAWEMMFHEVPSESLGLEWEPAHQMVQLIDPISSLRQWVKKIVHIHGKDATVDYDAIQKFGILGAENFVYHRTPGYGDCNWTDIISILQMGGYDSDICIEGYHDPIYNGDWEFTSQIHALKYLKWCRGGDFIPAPWMKG